MSGFSSLSTLLLLDDLRLETRRLFCLTCDPRRLTFASFGYVPLFRLRIYDCLLVRFWICLRTKNTNYGYRTVCFSFQFSWLIEPIAVQSSAHMTHFDVRIDQII